MSFVTIAGRIGRDAEVRTVGDQAVANFSVAEDIGFGERKKTQWWACALWGKRAEALAPYLTKGTPLTVFGNPELREYTKKDQSNGAELTVRVVEVSLQGRGSGASGADEATPARTARSAPAAAQPSAKDGGEFNDDIPFAFAAPILCGLLALAAGVGGASQYLA